MTLQQTFLPKIFNGLFLLLLCWAAGLLLYCSDVTHMTDVHLSPYLKADGIVVLTGGSERLPAGLDLLEKFYAPRLLISGVDPRVDAATLISNRPAHENLSNKLECCITLGVFAEDTHGNAKEAAGWVEKFKMKSIIMVTSNYHMRRALMEFHQALPQTMVYHLAVNPPSAHIDSWWENPGTATLLMEEYNKLLLATVKAALHSVMAP